MIERSKLVNARQVAGAIRLSLIDMQRSQERDVDRANLMGNVLHHLLITGQPQLEHEAYRDVIREASEIVTQIYLTKTSKLI